MGPAACVFNQFSTVDFSSSPSMKFCDARKIEVENTLITLKL
jgi:hypothetical protein